MSFFGPDADVNRRTLVVGGAATVVLTIASMTAVAAAQHAQTHLTGYGVGMRGGFNLTTCHVPAQLPGQRVTVALADMPGGPMMGDRSTMGGRSMMLRLTPYTVSAGSVTVVAYNHGTRTHELVVLPLQRGAVVGTRTVGADDTVDETGSLGEASKDCADGVGDGISAGAVSWVSLTLAPGRYELLCNLPGHYAAGMYAELDAP